MYCCHYYLLLLLFPPPLNASLYYFAYYSKGHALMGLGRPAEALQWFQKLHVIFKDDAEVTFQLAKM